MLIGFDGWDRLYGEEGDEILLGEAGADRLWGSGRDDALDAGSARPALAGLGHGRGDAGPRDDVVWAGETDAAVDSIDCGDHWFRGFGTFGHTRVRFFAVRSKAGGGTGCP